MQTTKRIEIQPTFHYDPNDLPKTDKIPPNNRPLVPTFTYNQPNYNLPNNPNNAVPNRPFYPGIPYNFIPYQPTLKPFYPPFSEQIKI